MVNPFPGNGWLLRVTATKNPQRDIMVGVEIENRSSRPRKKGVGVREADRASLAR